MMTYLYFNCGSMGVFHIGVCASNTTEAENFLQQYLRGWHMHPGYPRGSLWSSGQLLSVPSYWRLWCKGDGGRVRKYTCAIASQRTVTIQVSNCFLFEWLHMCIALRWLTDSITKILRQSSWCNNGESMHQGLSDSPTNVQYRDVF